jgi:glutaredoxin
MDRPTAASAPRNADVTRARKHLPRAAAFVLAAASLATQAQYKVVGPDGRVTYTDRPPADSRAAVAPIGGSAAPEGSSSAGLPPELQRAAQRFPVTLYVTADCAPCEDGRQFLQQRGVPYAVRRVGNSADDPPALERATGGRSVPALTIGTQALSGFSRSEWDSYLDAAGYPRESRLPRGWTPPPPTPLVERKPVAAAVPPPAAVPSTPAPAALPQPTPGIRF